MTLQESIASCIAKYFDFAGEATRSFVQEGDRISTSWKSAHVERWTA
jgi:hypothetical protein